MKRIALLIMFPIIISFLFVQTGCTVRIGESRVQAPPPPPAKPAPPPWAPAHGHRAKYRYYYYPEYQVYFDPGRKLYFYYQGAGWHVSAYLPSGVYISAGDYVTLEMDADHPYVYHEYVIERYPPKHHKKNKDKKGKDKKWD